MAGTKSVARTPIAHHTSGDEKFRIRSLNASVYEIIRPSTMPKNKEDSGTPARPGAVCDYSCREFYGQEHLVFLEHQHIGHRSFGADQHGVFHDKGCPHDDSKDCIIPPRHAKQIAIADRRCTFKGYRMACQIHACEDPCKRPACQKRAQKGKGPEVHHPVHPSALLRLFMLCTSIHHMPTAFPFVVADVLDFRRRTQGKDEPQIIPAGLTVALLPADQSEQRRIYYDPQTIPASFPLPREDPLKELYIDPAMLPAYMKDFRFDVALVPFGRFPHGKIHEQCFICGGKSMEILGK
ncbi:hypothetical protein MMC25_000529 [Agyrium rufum]|nr:hypothetical protein [Agyrium rufum]